MNKSIAKMIVGLSLFCTVAATYAATDLSIIEKADVDLLLSTTGAYDEIFNSSNIINFSDTSFDLIDEIVLSQLTQENFYDVVSSDNEPAVEKGQSDNFEYVMDLEQNMLLLRNRRTRFIQDGPLLSTLTLNGAEENALRDLAAIGVNNLDDLEFFVTTLQRTTIDEENVRTEDTVAYKVFIHRSINGIRVNGTKIVMSYFLDGSLHKLSMHWPTILPQNHKTFSVVSQQVILDAAYEKLRSHSLGTGKRQLSVGHRYKIQNGLLSKILTISGKLIGPNGSAPIATVEVDI